MSTPGVGWHGMMRRGLTADPSPQLIAKRSILLIGCTRFDGLALYFWSPSRHCPQAANAALSLRDPGMVDALACGDE